MNTLVRVAYHYPVHFTRAAFDPDNDVLRGCLADAGAAGARVLAVLDGGLVDADPTLPERLSAYAADKRTSWRVAGPAVRIPGGEQCKNDPEHLQRLLAAMERAGLCRHSVLLAVGGGALLDLAGYAAAILHRGVRLLRMPSTVLAQNDAGVGVKNGVNAFGRKNFLGCFAPPLAVVDDFDLLRTLSPRDQRAGLAEAVKVALVRDGSLFEELEQRVDELARFDEDALAWSVRRCAQQHLEHIETNGDPFEWGSARPLDFGHWSAHALEEVTEGQVRHGEAVAVGMALDALYAERQGLLDAGQRQRILDLLSGLGFALWHPALGALDLQAALESFREHLGGELTVTLPQGIGRRLEVHRMDPGQLAECRLVLERAFGVARPTSPQGASHGTRQDLPALG